MIKLTLKDGTTREYLVDYPAVCFNGNDWFFYLGFESEAYLEMEKISKIEKEVQFLTNEEMIKLDCQLIKHQTRVGGKLVFTYNLYCNTNDKFYELTDYIDITDMIMDNYHEMKENFIKSNSGGINND